VSICYGCAFAVAEHQGVLELKSVQHSLTLALERDFATMWRTGTEVHRLLACEATLGSMFA